MLEIKDIQNLLSKLGDGNLFRVVAYRSYNDSKARKQGVDYMATKTIVETLLSLDKSCDRQCGLGCGEITIDNKGDEYIIDYVFKPAIIFYKTLKQRLVATLQR